MSVAVAFFCNVQLLTYSGHDLNAFGNGGPIAPVSAPRSYDIPTDFLGAHTFPRVQVFSVCFKPLTAAATALVQDNFQQVSNNGNSGARGKIILHFVCILAAFCNPLKIGWTAMFTGAITLRVLWHDKDLHPPLTAGHIATMHSCLCSET